MRKKQGSLKDTFKLAQAMDVVCWFGAKFCCGFFRVKIDLVDACFACAVNVAVQVISNHQALVWCYADEVQGMFKNAFIGFFVAAAFRRNNLFKVWIQLGSCHFNVLYFLKTVCNNVQAILGLQVIEHLKGKRKHSRFGRAKFNVGFRNASRNLVRAQAKAGQGFLETGIAEFFLADLAFVVLVPEAVVNEFILFIKRIAVEFTVLGQLKLVV